jgi:linoleate 10R-lipoxygenase
MRVVEIIGIEQARFWGVCTMNEFRQFLGLRRTLALCCRFCHSPLTIYTEFETFEEWNPDPEIAVRLLSRFRRFFVVVVVDICCQNAARQLYGHVNNLELYVGNSNC